jgi:hypothetical protein
MLQRRLTEKSVSPDLIEQTAKGYAHCLISDSVLEQMLADGMRAVRANRYKLLCVYFHGAVKAHFASLGYELGKCRTKKQFALDLKKAMQPIPKPENLLEIAEMKDPKSKPARAEPPADDQKPFSFVEALLEARRKRVK